MTDSATRSINKWIPSLPLQIAYVAFKKNPVNLKELCLHMRSHFRPKKTNGYKCRHLYMNLFSIGFNVSPNVSETESKKNPIGIKFGSTTIV